MQKANSAEYYFGSKRADDTDFFKLLKSNEFVGIFKQATLEQRIFCIPPNAFNFAAIKSCTTSRQRVVQFISKLLAIIVCYGIV